MHANERWHDDGDDEDEKDEDEDEDEDEDDLGQVDPGGNDNGTVYLHQCLFASRAYRRNCAERHNIPMSALNRAVFDVGVLAPVENYSQYPFADRVARLPDGR
jgi:hypothetical protein